MRPEIWHSPVGLTHDAGWELDVRRTVPGPAAETWRRLLDEWLPQWLGVDSVPQMVGAPVHRGGRVRGRVIGCHVGRRVRLRWTPEILDHETVFQVTLQETQAGAAGVIAADGGAAASGVAEAGAAEAGAAGGAGVGAGTVLAIHQERLLGAAERQGLLEHWEQVLDELVTGLGREVAGRPLDLHG